MKPLLTPKEKAWKEYAGDIPMWGRTFAAWENGFDAAPPRSEPKEAGVAVKALEILKELHPLERVIPTRGQKKAWWAIGALEAYLSAPAKSEPDAEGLQDSHAVHINMLRGTIAKLTPAQVAHLYGNEDLAEIVAEIKRQHPEALAPDAEGGWQPIETAPKDGTSLMVWCADREIVTLAFWLEGNDVRKGYWSGHYETITPDEPTHWQPLPQPPL